MGPIRVLLVDEEADFRSVLRSVLGGDDRFEIVDEAADGHQAVALAALHQPDVVLLDVMMPEMDGLTAAAKIRQEVPNAWIVMLSSRDARTAERPALAAGADMFIEKHDVGRVAERLVQLLETTRG